MPAEIAPPAPVDVRPDTFASAITPPPSFVSPGIELGGQPTEASRPGTIVTAVPVIGGEPTGVEPVPSRPEAAIEKPPPIDETRTAGKSGRGPETAVAGAGGDGGDNGGNIPPVPAELPDDNPERDIGSGSETGVEQSVLQYKLDVKAGSSIEPNLGGESAVDVVTDTEQNVPEPEIGDTNDGSNPEDLLGVLDDGFCVRQPIDILDLLSDANAGDGGQNFSAGTDNSRAADETGAEVISEPVEPIEIFPGPDEPADPEADTSGSHSVSSFDDLVLGREDQGNTKSLGDTSAGTTDARGETTEVPSFDDLVSGADNPARPGTTTGQPHDRHTGDSRARRPADLPRPAHTQDSAPEYPGAATWRGERPTNEQLGIKEPPSETPPKRSGFFAAVLAGLRGDKGDEWNHFIDDTYSRNHGGAHQGHGAPDYDPGYKVVKGPFGIPRIIPTETAEPENK